MLGRLRFMLFYKGKYSFSSGTARAAVKTVQWISDGHQMPASPLFWISSLTSIQHLSIFIKIHRNGANIEIVAV
jgi:hypothetical protein